VGCVCGGRKGRRGAGSEEEEVIQLANDSEFGLAASVWTLDVRRAHRMARAMQSGTVWVNMYRGLAFNSPFGGYKQSGIGTQNGIEASTNIFGQKACGAS
jgi:acyl-CoA reductase-like NAD-dependent aldehyde dehydrogenase